MKYLLLLLLFFALPAQAWNATNGGTTITNIRYVDFNGATLTGDSVNGDATVTFSAGTPGGSDTQVQYNDAGSFGGDAGFVFDDVNGNVTVSGEFIENSSSSRVGGFVLPVGTENGSFTAASNTVYLVDATPGAVTVTLPAAASITNRVYYFKKIDAGVNTVTVDPNASETIDGDTIKVLSSQYSSLTIVSDGGNWFIL